MKMPARSAKALLRGAPPRAIIYAHATQREALQPRGA